MIYPASYDIVVLQNATFSMRLTAQSSGVPVNLSGYTIDADICKVGVSGHVATFTPSVVTTASGIFDLTLAPTVTQGLEPGDYYYDLSLTSASGERYYWLKGNLVVSGTCSRN